MNVTLYHFVGCPYCMHVQHFMSKEGITLNMKDIREVPRFRDELIRIGGKSQVPCLVINGKALYESLSIIDWLQQNLVAA